MEEKYKVILAHPGQQHSYHSAIALGDDLHSYITTNYYKRFKSLTWFASLFAGNDLKARMQNRKCKVIDNKTIAICEARGLLAQTGVQNKLPALRKFVNYYDSFGERVADICSKNNVDAVIGFDTAASACFEKLDKVGAKIVRILDVTIGSRIYAKDLYEKEMWDVGSDCLRREYPDLWKPDILNKFQKEIDLADYALVASNYVKNTLIYSGMPADRIFIVPYGTTQRKITRCNKAFDSRVELLFVGQINYRKGIHRLLRVIENFSEDDIHLNIAGYYSQDNTFYLKYKNDRKITFLGQVPHEQIGQLYQSSDVFILPSLSEGMARVGIEALGCGLPLICTDHSGVNDLIVDGENGFVIPTCDDEAMKEKIQWFIHNKQEIPRMSKCAEATGRRYTWDAYYANYHAVVRKIIEMARENRI